MYHIYSSECLVLRQIARGEKSAVLVLLSRDYGLLWAHAQGLRDMGSKLRHALTELSISEVSFVRGAGGFRVVGAIHKESIYQKLVLAADSKARILGREKVISIARVVSVISRLIHGEEKDERVYKTVMGIYRLFVKAPLSRPLIKSAEHIAILRILKALGYLGKSGALAAFAGGDDWSVPSLMRVGEHKREAVAEINRSLKATGL